MRNSPQIRHVVEKRAIRLPRLTRRWGVGIATSAALAVVLTSGTAYAATESHEADQSAASSASPATPPAITAQQRADLQRMHDEYIKLGADVANAQSRHRLQALRDAFSREFPSPDATGTEPAPDVTDWAGQHHALSTAVDPATGGLTVVVPRSSSPLRQADVPPLSKPVKVVQSTKTQADVDAEESAAISWARSHPQYTFGIGFDSAQDAVVVRTDAPGSTVASLKTSHPKIAFEASFAAARNANRDDDGFPRSGGATITGQGRRCTAGFSMNSFVGQGTFSVTAAHCFGGGVATFTPALGYYGTTQRIAPFPDFDVEELNCFCQSFYGPRIWTDFTTTVHVSGASSSGETGYFGRTGICVSGSTTGTEKCGASIRAYNETLCDSAGCTTGLLRYSRGSGTQMTFSGDSGAPVYFHNNSNNEAHIIGLHVGNLRGFDGSYQQYAETFSGIALSTSANILT